MPKFEEFQFRKQPWYTNEYAIRQLLPTLIPVKTLVIFCFDPRADEIPKAVAEHFGDEVYPGENVLDEAGNRVGSTATLFRVSNAGGRAISALQSISTMEYLVHIERVIVAHHSFCGATSFTADGFINAFRREQAGAAIRQFAAPLLPSTSSGL